MIACTVIYLTFQIKSQGYGGVSRLHCLEETMTSQSVNGYPCVSIQHFSSEENKDVMVHNIGARSAIVKVTVYNGWF